MTSTVSTIAVTAATGQLGRLVVADLLTRVPAEQIVAVARDAARAADLGVPVREADYGDRAALTAAFAGVDRVLLVSGSEVGQRVDQHRNVIEAAVAAGVGHLVYTSAPHADDTTLVLAPDHKMTENLVRDSGITWTVLRNNWYSENYAATVATARDTGEIVTATGDGRVASAARSDFAQAAAAVLTSDERGGTVYELGGDVAWTFPEFAADLSTVLGTEVVHRAVTPTELDAWLAAVGLDEGTRGFVVALDVNIAEGTLSEVTGDLPA